MVLLCKSLLGVYIPCGAVYYFSELDQDYYLGVLGNIDLWYDSITGHKTNLLFLLCIAVIYVPQVPSRRDYY